MLLVAIICHARANSDLIGIGLGIGIGIGKVILLLTPSGWRHQTTSRPLRWTLEMQPAVPPLPGAIAGGATSAALCALPPASALLPPLPQLAAPARGAFSKGVSPDVWTTILSEDHITPQSAILAQSTQLPSTGNQTG